MKRTSQLQIRMTVSFVLSTILPMLVVGIVFALAFISLNRQSVQSQQENLTQIGREQILHHVSDITTQMILLGSLVNPESPSWQASLETTCAKAEEPYYLLSVINQAGQEIARLENCKAVAASSLTNRAKEDVFIEAMKGEPYYGGVSATDDGSAVMAFAVQTQDKADDDIVILSQVDMSHIWESLNALVEANGNILYVVNDEGVLIGYKDSTLVRQKKPMAEVSSVRPLLEKKQGVAALNYRGLLGVEVIGSSTYIDGLNWGVVLEQPIELAYGVHNRLVGILVVALLVFSGLATVLALYLSRGIIVPLRKMAEVAQAASNGNLDTKIEVKSNDEIGITATAFNQMTTQLKQTLSGLEEKIAERTQELEDAQSQSEKRAASLEAITEISRAISTEQEITRLMNQVTELVSEKFGYYHVGIFLIDEQRRYAVLQSANSEGGKRMLVRNHKLEVGQIGLVGYVSQYGRARIALDVGADSVYFNNPDLPLTHSEMALPLRVRGTTIGVLDVQSEESNAFGEADINLLSVLADQVAIAIENARLFGQAQKALADAQSLYDQYLGQQWKKTLQEENKFAYHQSAMGGQPLDTEIRTPEILRALKQGEMIVVKPSASQEESSSMIVMPVKLRNQVIGILNIKPQSADHAWSQDEINMVKLISDRLALTLETARLFNESQRRAAKEQIIGEISSKISASFNMRSVLQTTAEELGRALPGSEVLIQFTDQDKK